MFFGTYSIIHVFETCKDMKNEAQCLGPIKPQERGGDDFIYAPLLSLWKTLIFE